MAKLESRPRRRIALLIGGLISIYFGIMHLAFWHLFDWRTTLAPLSPLNRAIMEVLNVHVAYTILVFGCLSLFLGRELLETRLGKVLTLCMSAFWFLRAVNELVFFESPPLQAAILIASCVGVGLLYTTAAWRPRAHREEVST